MQWSLTRVSSRLGSSRTSAALSAIACVSSLLTWSILHTGSEGGIVSLRAVRARPVLVRATRETHAVRANPGAFQRRF